MDGERPIPKKDIIKSMSYSGEHWMYDKVIEYSTEYNDALQEYHHKLPVYYNEFGKPMENDELDRIIYGTTIKKIA